MLLSARDPFHKTKYISYNKNIIKYNKTKDVYIFKKCSLYLKLKILSYLSNPEVSKFDIRMAKKLYNFLNSEIYITDACIKNYRYKWCEKCGERSVNFDQLYNCESCKKNTLYLDFGT